MIDETRASLLLRVRDTQDNDSWSQLTAIYGPWIEGYLCKVGMSRADAADVQQEVLQVLSRELPRFEHNGRPGAFRTWLRGVTANQIRSFYRKAKRQPQAVGGTAFLDVAEKLLDDESELSVIWNQAHDSHLVCQLLELVAPRFKPTTMQVFRRVIFKEEDPGAIASDLGISVNAVWVAKSKVLRAMRELGNGLIDEFSI